MKRILLALTVLALILPALPQAKGADVSVDFFYNNLSGGNWIEVGDYGYGWQPDVAVNDPNWRPYADGYWGYTDVGWTWISYEDFGWATYHYGRWARLADYGWMWFPGSDLEWGPAWVSWRTGGDYVGWAPLPPRPGIVYGGQPIGVQVDLEFDIGPSYYNFVDLRYIGEPVLRDRIFAPARNITIINNTVNVTNITYNNSTVYNYGPDYNRLNQYSTRPIQRLSLERQTTVDSNLSASKANLNKVEGGKLLVVAPTIQKSAQKIAPKMVKTRVEQPKIEHGWTGVSDKAQIQQKMKAENAKEVPPPTFQPTNKKEAQAPASTTPATGEASVTPAQGAERKGRKGQKAEQPAAAPAVSGTAEPSAAPEKPGKGKHKGVSAAPGQTGAAPIAPEATQPPSKHKGEYNQPAPAPTASQSTEETTSPMERGKGKGRKGAHEAPTPSSPTSDEQRGPGAESPRGAMKGRVPEERAATETVAPRGQRAAEQAQRPGGPQRPEQAQSPQQRRGERAAEDKRKKKPAEVTASPTP